MPITTSAKKALRNSLHKRVFNTRRRAALMKAVKVVKAKKGDAKESLRNAFQAIDKAAQRGIITKNTAARKKSRLAKAVAKV